MLVKDMIGKKVLVNTKDWLIAPDGEQYKAVYGTVKEIFLCTEKEVPGAKNSNTHANWYLQIGNTFVNVCDVGSCIITDSISVLPPKRRDTYEGALIEGRTSISLIYVDNN